MEGIDRSLCDAECLSDLMEVLRVVTALDHIDLTCNPAAGNAGVSAGTVPTSYAMSEIASDGRVEADICVK